MRIIDKNRTRFLCNITLDIGALLFYNEIDKRGDKYMPIKYKIDILKAMKEKGYSTARIRKEKIMGESMLQKIREGQMMSWATLDTVCRLLEMQPSDLLEYVAIEDNDR